ncbi:MAG: glycosyltransferase family 4 protein [Anaerolineae bacterium]|nr:glycosyltransferase family 4 protein [Anaerolineae bacterium]
MLELIWIVPTVVLSYFLVYAIKKWATTRRILDIPNYRSSHTLPVPRGGGWGIVLVVLGGSLVYGFWHGDVWDRLLPYLLGVSLIVIISWIDDTRFLRAHIRLLVHLISAAIAVVGLGYWQQVDLPVVGTLDLGVFGILITVIWIAGVINAVNFMDGIDGISGGQTAVIGLGWFLVAQSFDGADIRLVAMLGVLLAGSSLGFLGHNWAPATIFLGDIGSTFIGYTLAVMPLMLSGSHRTALATGTALMLWAYLFDTGYTLLCRLKRGEDVFQAHRSHLYQQLVILGYGHRVVSILYMMLSAAGYVLLQAWVSDIAGAEWACVLVIPLLGLTLWIVVVYQRANQRAKQQQSGPLPNSHSSINK